MSGHVQKAAERGFQPKAVLYSDKGAIQFEVVEHVEAIEGLEHEKARREANYLHRVMVTGSTIGAGGRYQWTNPQQTIRTSLDYADTADLCAVLLGLRTQHHFKRKHYGLKLTRQNGQLRIHMSRSQLQIEANIGGEAYSGDIVRVSGIAMLALQRQMHGLDGTLMMQALRGAYRITE